MDNTLGERLEDKKQCLPWAQPVGCGCVWHRSQIGYHAAANASCFAGAFRTQCGGVLHGRDAEGPMRRKADIGMVPLALVVTTSEAGPRRRSYRPRSFRFSLFALESGKVRHVNSWRSGSNALELDAYIGLLDLLASIEQIGHEGRKKKERLSWRRRTTRPPSRRRCRVRRR